MEVAWESVGQAWESVGVAFSLQLYFLRVLGGFGGPPLEVSGGGCGNTVRYKQWVFRFGYCYCVCVWPCAIRFTSSSRILRKLYSVEKSLNKYDVQ